MTYFDIRDVLENLHYRNRRLVEEILRNHTVDEQDFEHALLACDECGSLKNRFWVRLRYGGDKIFETIIECRKCHRPMRRIPEKEVVKLKCPDCEQAALKSALTMMWD